MYKLLLCLPNIGMIIGFVFEHYEFLIPSIVINLLIIISIICALKKSSFTVFYLDVLLYPLWIALLSGFEIIIYIALILTIIIEILKTILIVSDKNNPEERPLLDESILDFSKPGFKQKETELCCFCGVEFTNPNKKIYIVPCNHPAHKRHPYCKLCSNNDNNNTVIINVNTN